MPDSALWERIERLQDATSRLAGALTADDLSRVLLAIIEEVLEASAGVVYLVDADGTLGLRASRGVPSVERYQKLPFDAPVPLATAVATRTPVYFGSYEELVGRYPHVAGAKVARADLRAVAALPLMHGSRVLGGFAVSFAGEHTFNEHERRWLDTRPTSPCERQWKQPDQATILRRERLR